ncbi:hypothetical protein ACO22_05409 [Paracoccidioides brasiliensis]|uniref:Uncharacterized protein n=1 Tax=Paracoccidioides brasiliensis TaxID=121759 RepID=A0A1D2JAI8_PARBR|nr:hypothetical protein ACO22_05409 [Paracoccidioides brasiliensis]
MEQRQLQSTRRFQLVNEDLSCLLAAPFIPLWKNAVNHETGYTVDESLECCRGGSNELGRKKGSGSLTAPRMCILHWREIMFRQQAAGKENDLK